MPDRGMLTGEDRAKGKRDEGRREGEYWGSKEKAMPTGSKKKKIFPPPPPGIKKNSSSKAMA